MAVMEGVLESEFPVFVLVGEASGISGCGTTFNSDNPLQVVVSTYYPHSSAVDRLRIAFALKIQREFSSEVYSASELMLIVFPVIHSATERVNLLLLSEHHGLENKMDGQTHKEKNISLAVHLVGSLRASGKSQSGCPKASSMFMDGRFWMFQ
ncbi:hypothetical protein Tco_1135354 [Tanacetum coccineum]